MSIPHAQPEMLLRLYLIGSQKIEINDFQSNNPVSSTCLVTRGLATATEADGQLMLTITQSGRDVVRQALDSAWAAKRLPVAVTRSKAGRQG